VIHFIPRRSLRPALAAGGKKSGPAQGWAGPPVRSGSDHDTCVEIRRPRSGSNRSENRRLNDTLERRQRGVGIVNEPGVRKSGFSTPKGVFVVLVDCGPASWPGWTSKASAAVPKIASGSGSSVEVDGLIHSFRPSVPRGNIGSAAFSWPGAR
jgi:hypothetical protein